MESPGSEFCFPCTKCGSKFDSLRFLRRHMCEPIDKELKILTTSKLDYLDNPETNQTQPINDPFVHDSILEEKVVGYVVSTNNQKKEIRSGFKCDECFEMFRSDASRKKHVQNHKIDRFPCELCEPSDQIFSKRTLIRHKFDIHGIKMNQFTCNICKKATNHKSHHESHVRTHGERVDHICSECGKAFKGKYGLDDHMKRHKNMFDIECNFCEKKFVTKGILSGHIATSHGEPKYSCTICEKKYTNSTGLRDHMTKHTGEKRYQCKFCKKQFRLFNYWKDHENMHQDIRNYKCTLSLSPKDFVRLNGLDVHMKRHNNQRDHVCTVCGKGFIEPAGLKKHKCTG